MYLNLKEARCTGIVQIVQMTVLNRQRFVFLFRENGICQQCSTARRFERGTHTAPSHICLISRPTMAAILDVADRLPARKTESCGVAN